MQQWIYFLVVCVMCVYVQEKGTSPGASVLEQQLNIERPKALSLEKAQVGEQVLSLSERALPACGACALAAGPAQ